ncbi:hypothetical protein MRX96_005127 [Rhipicephalus microplus]
MDAAGYSGNASEAAVSAWVGGLATRGRRRQRACQPKRDDVVLDDARTATKFAVFEGGGTTTLDSTDPPGTQVAATRLPVSQRAGGGC